MLARRLFISRPFSASALLSSKKPAAEPAPPKTTVAHTVLPNAGTTYGSSGAKVLGGREGAMEDQWAYEHDKELMKKLLARMKQMEDALKSKGIDLPEEKK